MSNTCASCGESFGLLRTGIELSDGSLCDACARERGLPGERILDKVKDLGGEQTVESVKDVLGRLSVHDDGSAGALAPVLVGRWGLAHPAGLTQVMMTEEFAGTYVVSAKSFQKVVFDDVHGLMYVGLPEGEDRNGIVKLRGYVDGRIIPYEKIISFEVLQNSHQVASGGLGRAVVGGLLFGGAGAVVGAVTGKSTSVEERQSIKVNITLDNPASPLVTVTMFKKGLLSGDGSDAASETQRLVAKLNQVFAARERGVVYAGWRGTAEDFAAYREWLEGAERRLAAASAKPALPSVPEASDFSTCPVCGTRNPADARFCTACGGAIEGVSGDATEAEPAPGATGCEDPADEGVVPEVELPADPECEDDAGISDACGQEPAGEGAPEPEAAPLSEQAADPVAEIRRYKELLDEGILTEEEFAAKKRQLLGI